jgi:hypothetical protein
VTIAEAAAAHAAELEQLRSELERKVTSLGEDLQAKRAELDAARGGDAEKNAAAAAQEEALNRARADADTHAQASAAASVELEVAAARQVALESELADYKSQSAAAASAAAGSSAEAEVELQRQLRIAQAEVEGTKLQMQALQAAAGTDGEDGTFSMLAEWEAVLAVEALLQGLEEEQQQGDSAALSEEDVTAAVSEGGFSDFGAFLKALKSHDCACSFHHAHSVFVLPCMHGVCW